MKGPALAAMYRTLHFSDAQYTVKWICITPEWRLPWRIQYNLWCAETPQINGTQVTLKGLALPTLVG